MVVRSLLAAVLVVVGSCASLAAEVDFARDVLPVLQRSCFECHGREKAAGGLKLDTAESLQKGGDSGTVVVAGKAANSELLRRISLPKSDSEVMPNRGDVLTPDEVARIRDWINAGAVWPAGAKLARHWAYVTPVKAPLPQSSSHPVDAFVLDKLKSAGLQPSPPASAAVIARRLYFDVIGLPPTPAQVTAFEQAASRDLPSAVEKLVDELLRSPQYGEKWARPWLDAARYADSHGFQRDDLRELWPYRDWVIRALNDDMPFDQFTLEQLAGDLLPNATQDQRIASGFNRCAPCNVEAGTDPEENRVNQVFDRVNTLGAVWLGTTFECAQCHDHKYDPITHRDYYGLFAYFNQTEIEAERSNPRVPGSIRFLGPYLDIKDPAFEQQREKLTQEIAGLKAGLANFSTTTTTATAEEEPKAEILVPIDFDSAGDAGHKILDDGSILLVGDPPATDTYTITVHTKLKNITGFKLEALTDESLPGMGPGRGDPQRTNFVLHEFSVQAASLDAASRAEKVPLADATASFSQQGWDVSGAIDGKAKTGWAIGPRFKQSHWASFRTARPIGFEQGTTLTFKLEQNFGQARTLGRVRLSALTGEAKPAPKQPIAASPAKRELESQLSALENRLKGLKPPRTLVMQQVAQLRPTTMFNRGDFRTPGEAIQAATPVILTGTNKAIEPDRIALARWLCSDENPLTARVAVNRVWQELFGEGLVTTPEDFGIKGQRPTHPELLDWLAVEYREQGWSQKKLLKAILTSETYRQSSRLTPELSERDPQNRLLARGPSYRLSAEGIRDNALAIAGLIDLKQFGPPIYPPQPAGLWNKVGGEKYEYTVSPGSEQYRRGIYVVLKRMSPNPSMITFDATARLSCRVKRLRSNTPLQALTLLNDPVYVGAAQAFAQRIVREQPDGDLDARLAHAFRLAVARAPSAAELAVLRKLFNAEQAAGNEVSAWFAVASALLNLDETITKG
ncbi:Planctomycete cytochrome C [Anatilimnocola aggregata]|uniref:Planctomycete cytochrome C n=1 Tax=Anatilimnocola aggregata TaxID=2528021 RepID=A0A517YCI1_9BACT|nr:PSD1 and planctomycete cytochrome C domain-containing protein [Anatilimnocola aggregata]QDU27899.1 Planctomycete cytochrome C [Anatilimnocola aggregata]